jgi:hypothetical protein
MPLHRTLVVASLITAAITITTVPTEATALTKLDCDLNQIRCLSISPSVPYPPSGQLNQIMAMACIEAYSICLTLVPPEPSPPARWGGPPK